MKLLNIRWVRQVSRIRKLKNTYIILFGKSERKIPVERTRLKGRIILKGTFKIGFEDVD
jgi:hypothetical protein